MFNEGKYKDNNLEFSYIIDLISICSLRCSLTKLK